jgi:CRISPR-associated protein Csb2
MFRSLTCRAAKDDTHEFPGGEEVYVAGHVKRKGRHQRDTPPRFTYLPLPTIGHEHADGAIRRLLIAEPFGGDGAHASWAQQRLRNATLRAEHGDERGVLLELWRPRSRRIVGRYVREAKEWFSVTPVILPGLDDGKQSKAEHLLLKAVADAEVPIEAIESVTLRKAPFWPGSEHPRHYFVPDYLRPFARWHVALRFHEPVPGPLAIGAGRHAGLGLFAAGE